MGRVTKLCISYLKVITINLWLCNFNICIAYIAYGTPLRYFDDPIPSMMFGKLPWSASGCHLETKFCHKTSCRRNTNALVHHVLSESRFLWRSHQIALESHWKLWSMIRECYAFCILHCSFVADNLRESVILTVPPVIPMLSQRQPLVVLKPSLY